MSLQKVTVLYVTCDCCNQSSRNDRATFDQYPDGAAYFLGSRLDLCDRCHLEGYVVSGSRIVKASEIEVKV
jgi:hypothetical protein